MYISRVEVPAMRAIAVSLAVVLAVASVGWGQTASAPAPKVLVNSIGFLPGGEKRATMAVASKKFVVVRVGDGKEVFAGEATGPVLNADSREQLYTADFSGVREPGKYVVRVEGVGDSAAFAVAEDVYNEPFYVCTRAMYLWRCGTAVTAVYKGETFHHEACHMEDAWLDLINGQHEKVLGTKGWHDAGDYNKYVVNAGVTVGSMFRAWEDFQYVLKGFRLDIPESGGKIPDFLAEIKWEMDWLLTMQAGDGSVYYKLSTKDFGGFILPEKETTPRYFTPTGSAATADFVAMTAAAARHYRPYDEAYADRCLAAAKKSYAYLVANPRDQRPDAAGVTTGGYGTSDPDDRLWAAAEMWETTGDAAALTDLETRLRNTPAGVQANWDWSSVGNLGAFTYVLSKREGRDATLMGQVKDSAISVAEAIVRTDRAHGYNRPLGTAYSWGGNGTVARQTMNLMVANRISPKAEYVQTAADALGYLLGRNEFGRSFVTGLGNLPPLKPHHRPSGGDTVAAPWPGYLVGGPNPGPFDWHDVQDDYRTNEVAINWNGALIYALAGFVKPSVGSER
jgi:endoglucanase